MKTIYGYILEAFPAWLKVISRNFGAVLLKKSKKVRDSVPLNVCHFKQVTFSFRCSDTWHRCDVNAVCNNTQGSYNCTCKDGFRGNGKNCTGNNYL